VSRYSDVISAWIDEGGRPETDLELRMIRRLPDVAARLDDRITDPIARALAGLEPPPATAASLIDRVRIAVAAGGTMSAAVLGDLEEEAKASGDANLWVTAARLHAMVNLGREAAARMSLSEQSLPYVFPGEIDEVMVDLLAVADRVLPALHVDWVRKLTQWIAPVLALDCRAQGMWFWPVLGSLDGGKLARPLAKLAQVPLGPGGAGLALSYSLRIGLEPEELTAKCEDLDRRIIALARLGDGAS